MNILEPIRKYSKTDSGLSLSCTNLSSVSSSLVYGNRTCSVVALQLWFFSNLFIFSSHSLLWILTFIRFTVAQLFLCFFHHFCLSSNFFPNLLSASLSTSETWFYVKFDKQRFRVIPGISIRGFVHLSVCMLSRISTVEMSFNLTLSWSYR